MIGEEAEEGLFHENLKGNISNLLTLFSLFLCTVDADNVHTYMCTVQLMLVMIEFGGQTNLTIIIWLE